MPGCNHSTFLDVHHLQPRSEGGPNAAYNLYRAVYRGELLIEREPDGALTFRHADGSMYGAPAAPRPIDAFTKVFSALRQLGFREDEVRAVLGDLRGDTAIRRYGAVSVGCLLREALCRIKPVAR